MKISKPNRGSMKDPDQTLGILLEMYDALVELNRRAPANPTAINSLGQTTDEVMNLAALTVDFGTAGSTNASVVATAPWATANSKIVACIADDVRADDAVAEGLTVGVSGHRAGGFTVWAAARLGALGQYKIHAVGA